jgi:two-component system nitrate/nitrite sensor histidine kinase NarX
MLYFLVDRTMQFYGELVKLQSQIGDIENNSINTRQRLDAVLQLSRKFVEANDENDVIELLLRLSVELVGSIGASFVPLDERGQPLTAVSYGDLPALISDAWIEYLASPAMRTRCGTCQNYGLFTRTCPLIQIPLSEGSSGGITSGIYCLPLRRGDREFGILNLYLPGENRLDEQAQEFLRTMLDETSLAIESIRLRRREIATLRQLHVVQRRTDLTSQLHSFLENVQETLKADFVLLLLQEGNADSQLSQFFVGKYPTRSQALIHSVVQGAMTSSKPLLLGDMEGENPSNDDIRSLVVAPLIIHNGTSLGVLLSVNLRAQNFSQRHLSLLQTLASQVTLVVRNSQLVAEIEFKTLMAERTRLAREIHDGLAQTLGFLKLQNAQMQNYLSQKDDAKLKESLIQSYKVLSDAYLDARQAIDGLRIAPEGFGILKWLEQTLIEFEENSGLEGTLEESHEFSDLEPEVQAQLIRIVQEALSNIRKHAYAKGVWISLSQEENDLVLEVRDDGCGFEPDDIPSTSRYGLQGMRERAELIGADFQVISRLHEGTIIRIRLPLTSGETIS